MQLAPVRYRAVIRSVSHPDAQHESEQAGQDRYCHCLNARQQHFRLGIYALLALGNLAAWTWAVLAFPEHPVLLGAALLAYGFGLRHAVDADHIAAIDNATRKLMQEGKCPVSVGFYFALGHSTVVALAAAGVAGTATALAGSFEQFKAVGGITGTSISALFLFVIAAANIVVLRTVWRTLQHVRRGGSYVDEDLDLLLNSRGLLARLFRLITRSWHMALLGFLFGLGFDTATEVALLGTSATQAAQGIPVWSIMVFPALFAAGMTLVDTTGGILMLGAYKWALVNPVRKLTYNLVLTAASVIVAVLVRGVEALGLLSDQLELQGTFWNGVGALNDDMGTLGLVIIGLFAASWAGSVVLYRYKGLDDSEARSTHS